MRAWSVGSRQSPPVGGSRAAGRTIAADSSGPSGVLCVFRLILQTSARPEHVRCP